MGKRLAFSPAELLVAVRAVGPPGSDPTAPLTIAHLTVRCALSHAAAWAPAGHVVASDQLSLPLPDLAAVEKAAKLAPLAPPPAAEALTCVPTESGWVVSGTGPQGEFSVEVRKADGSLGSMLLDGHAILTDQGSGGVSLYRPPCDGDLGTPMRPGIQSVPPSAARKAQRNWFLRNLTPDSTLFHALYKRRLFATLYSFAGWCPSPSHLPWLLLPLTSLGARRGVALAAGRDRRRPRRVG